MASSNTANWSVYSRNRKANVEELSWWFQGPKYLQFALRATRTHLTPTSYQQSRQLFIRHKLARQSKIRELLSGKNPKATVERGKMAFDWPRCPSLNLPGPNPVCLRECRTAKKVFELWALCWCSAQHAASSHRVLVRLLGTFDVPPAPSWGFSSYMQKDAHCHHECVC